MQVLTVARRFCGPPGSANGGYFSGLLGCLSDHTLTVRLLRPPPLDAELAFSGQPDGRMEVTHAGVAIAEATPATLELTPPTAPEYAEVIEASRGYAGFVDHRFPTCFVCGTQRAREDGLRIFAGPVANRDLVAAPWVPDASLDRGDGKVRPEFMSAALDCPGYFSVCAGDRMMLLGQFTAHVDRLVHIGDPCTVIGWKLGGSGRKLEAGTALYDGNGELCGRARAVWIEPRTF